MKFTPAVFNSIRPIANVYDATTNPIRTSSRRMMARLSCITVTYPSIVPTGTLAYYSAVVKQIGRLN